MTEVVSVRFRNKGKVYYFDPAGITVDKGQNVVVETSKGLEYAECVRGNHSVDDGALIPPLRPIVRIATEEDTRIARENRQKEVEAMAICREKIAGRQLEMKLVDVEYNFEGNKILFFFTSDGRVDFRDLVKDLAAVFKTRIELRQIGVRDEARMLGGLGICGKPFCCAQFLDDFQPVSIKMAKTQGLSLNPTKISGTCGRLMCCLKYEQEAYEDLVKNVPKVDCFVDTPAGKGTIVDVNLLRGRVRVRLEDAADTAFKTYDASEVEVLGGKAKRNEYLAQKAEERQLKEEERQRLLEQRQARQQERAQRQEQSRKNEQPEEKEQTAPRPKREHRSRKRQRPQPQKAAGEKPAEERQEQRGGEQTAPQQKKSGYRHRRYRGKRPGGNGGAQGDKPAE